MVRSLVMILHINGWPGVGKLTIARIVARALGARLLDNHTLMNPAEALLDRDDPRYWELRARLRQMVLEVAAQAPPASIVFTDGFGENDPRDVAAFADIVRLAETRVDRLFAVVLDCSLEENARRLVESERASMRKLTKPDVLARLRVDYTLLRPAIADRLDLDVTSLSAAESATAILDFVRERS